jgi:hypothetical protein
MKFRKNLAAYSALLCVLSIAMGQWRLSAQVPSLLEYDGYFTGNITGNRTIGVRLYNASTNGTLLYKETIGTLKVTQGQFYFQYGQNGTAGNGTTPTTIGATLTGSQQWLALTVNGTEQSPRERLVAVPFALRSADAQKTDADLRQVVDAVGKVVVAFGGNASNLISNPAATIATMENTAKNVLEMQKRFRVIGLTGNLSFGNSGTLRQLVISNTGFDRLAVSGITYPIGFSGNWTGNIAPGASQSVPVTFKPTALQSYSGNIVVASDASNGVKTIALSGQGARSVGLSGNLSFGNNNKVNVGVTRRLTITNTGTMNLTVSGITYPSGFSGNWSGTIAAGASQNVTVTFTPKEVLPYNGELIVASNAASGSAGKMAVSGSVVGALYEFAVKMSYFIEETRLSMSSLKDDTVYCNRDPDNDNFSDIVVVILVDGEYRSHLNMWASRRGTSLGYRLNGTSTILTGIIPQNDEPGSFGSELHLTTAKFSLTGPDQENGPQSISVYGYSDTLYFDAKPNTNIASKNMILSIDGNQRLNVSFTTDRIGTRFGYKQEGSNKILRGVFAEGDVNLQSAQ